MAKSKFFRVAVEGETVDGRKIERAHIEQMAATYDRATYTARINCEHLRGFSPNPPFNAYGSIDAVKSEEVTLKIGGKHEKRLALYASFDVNDQAKELTKADQKVFSSVEINPNFASTGKAYLVGIALTDSPASLGTEILKFSSRDDARKDNLIALADPFAVEFQEESVADNEVTGAFASMKKFFDSFMSAGAADLKTPPAPPADERPDQFAQFAAGMIEGFGKVEAAFKASNDATTVQIGKLTEDLAMLKTSIEEAPASGFSKRPPATGGDGTVKTEF